MAFIRVMCDSGDLNRWLKGDLAAAELMKHIAGNDESILSVYNVMTAIEETKAIAAHYLVLAARQSFTTISALRIEPRDINDLEILVEETEGKTGVTEIDAKHRNLIGNKDKFEALFQRLYDALRHGEDCIRVIGKIQLTYHVREFLNLSSDAISDRAKNQCRRLLGVGG
jgi:hypothetical protein